MTRFLVTGGCGFIGSALVRRLVGAGETVLNLDLLTYAALPGSLDGIEGMPNYSFIHASVADFQAAAAAFSAFKPEVVVNLAAESHVDRSIDDAAPFVTTNIVGVGTLLSAATDYWVGQNKDPDFRFVQVSTDEVFGSITSGSFVPGSPYQPSSPYAASKAAGDHLARSWFQTYGLPVIVTNSSNNFGPYQHPEKLIPLMTTRAFEGLDLPIYGNGGHERDWIHVDDHVDGLLRACQSGKPGETYLFGSGASRSNRSVTEHICSVVDRLLGRPPGTSQSRVRFVSDRPGHDRRYCVDTSFTGRALGWSCRSDFESGLAATVEWYWRNREWWLQIVRTATARRGLHP